jgi:ABC-2 type transport system permease protein
MGATITLWQKYMQKSLIHPEEIVGLLIQPVLWVALFGIGMKSLMGSVMPGAGDDYMTFMVPGIVALTALGGAIGGGSGWLSERLRGILKEYLVAPIPRLSILMGNASSITTKALIQAIIILIVGVLLGAKLSSNPLGWLGGLILIAGYALGFAGIALAFASKTDSSEAYHMMIFMLNLPLLFLSNALYPLQTLPTWMQIGAYLNPTTYVVSGLRQTMMAVSPDASGVETIPLWLCFLVVAVFTTLGMGLALNAFKSAIK